MSCERNIISRLMESSLIINGHKYECYFGKYYKDGTPIDRDQYIEETGSSSTYGGATYEPSDDGEHIVAKRNGQVYHLDPDEVIDDEEDKFVNTEPENIRFYIVRRYSNGNFAYLHKPVNGTKWLHSIDKDKLVTYSSEKEARRAATIISQRYKQYGDAKHYVKSIKL